MAARPALRHCALFFWLVILAAPGAFAQDAVQKGIPAEVSQAWERAVAQAQRLLDLEDVSDTGLDRASSDLAEQRSEILGYFDEAQSSVDDLRASLEALGPAPSDAESEAAEVAERRGALGDALQNAQVTLLAAETALEQTESALDQIDTRAREQFSGRLLTLGPSPLWPRYWGEAAQAAYDFAANVSREAQRRIESKFWRQRVLANLPIGLLLILLGLLFSFGLRRRFDSSVQEGLRETRWTPVALVLGRLVLPGIGATALVAGIGMIPLYAAAGQALIGALPKAALVVVLGYWAGHSFFAPRFSEYRIVPLEDREARAGARWSFMLGLALGGHILLEAAIEQQGSSPAIAASLGFPVLLLTAVILWRLARIMRPVLMPRAAVQGDGEEVLEPFGLNMARRLRSLTLAAVILAPVAAAIGYMELAEYILYALAFSIGLIGCADVAFVTFQRGLDTLLSRSNAQSQEERFGLLPVLVGFVILIGSLPIFALIWGARQSDLLEIWVWLRDGISIGGSRISLTDFLIFVLVFTLGYTATRFLQSVLRRTVLPRTRLDVGGQNAVTTGVGYLGIFLAAMIAITTTGLDLSNLAIVAGALSVGVGFGLQTIVSNFVSGIILLIERPIKQGDWIEVAGYSGYVRKISVRSTEIETFDRSNVIVPNQELIAGTVLNYTHGSVNGRVIVPVGVAYGSDARQVEAILREVAEGHPLVLRRPPPSVVFMGFGADSLDFEIRAILRDVNYALSAKSDMNFEIYKRFADEGIEIPFAQRDINIRNPEALTGVLQKD